MQASPLSRQPLQYRDMRRMTQRLLYLWRCPESGRCLRWHRHNRIPRLDLSMAKDFGRKSGNSALSRQESGHSRRQQHSRWTPQQDRHLLYACWCDRKQLRNHHDKLVLSRSQGAILEFPERWGRWGMEWTIADRYSQRLDQETEEGFLDQQHHPWQPARRMRASPIDRVHRRLSSPLGLDSVQPSGGRSWSQQLAGWAPELCCQIDSSLKSRAPVFTRSKMNNWASEVRVALMNILVIRCRQGVAGAPKALAGAPKALAINPDPCQFGSFRFKEDRLWWHPCSEKPCRGVVSGSY